MSNLDRTTSAQGVDRGWRGRAEEYFEAWGYFVVRHRWPASIFSIFVTLWLVSFLPSLTIDNSTESFLRVDDPAVLAYNEFREQFGRDDRIIVSIETPDPFDLEFLERLRELHDAFESEVPFVEEVESLINARFTRGEERGLVVGELLEKWPETEADLAIFRERVLSNPLYRNSLISADGSVTAIVVTPETFSPESPANDELSGFGDGEGARDLAPIYLKAAEGDRVITALYDVMDRFEAPDFRLHMAGALPMTHRINVGMQRDLGRFLPATLLLMCIVLGLLFRRVGGVFLSLMVVVLSLVATLGVMIILEIPGSTAVQILPVFLLTVGVCDAVHILAIVYRFRMEGMNERDSIARALAHSGLAVLMTSVTTAVGMASFITAEMAAVMHLGILAPIGVALAFVYTMVLLPSLLAIFPLPAPRHGRIAEGVFPFESFLVAAGSFACRSPWRVLVPTSGLIVLAVLGALQTTFSHNGLSWFPEDDRTRLDFESIDAQLGGSVSLDVVIDTGAAGGLYEPQLLTEIDRLTLEIENLAIEPIVVGSTLSILDIVEETHQALNENRPEMRRIPDSREAVAQELLLFENSGSDDTEELVDSEFRMTRINLRVPFVDALLFPGFLEDVSSLLDRRLEGRADYRITGLMTLLAQIFDAVIVSMGRSYVFAIGVITPLMMLLLGSLRRGLVSMVPNLIPIVGVLAVMGWLGLAIDTTTMLIGAMVIGIAVDDTIHFMHKFHRYFEESGDLEEAVRETLRTTGSALLFTSLVLAAGFSIFGLSEMANIRIFGLLSAFAALLAFIADLLVAPALLAVVEGHRARRAQAKSAVADG
ncbi:MAG: MMPL family transporter [bacterium]|nr:MMPL family transporter [bacterium]